MKLHTKADWQTRGRGTDRDEYEIYRSCADDGQGRDITTSEVPEERKPLKTFEEWLRS